MLSYRYSITYKPYFNGKRLGRNSFVERTNLLSLIGILIRGSINPKNVVARAELEEFQDSGTEMRYVLTKIVKQGKRI